MSKWLEGLQNAEGWGAYCTHIRHLLELGLM